jgi:uncharacterized membrane protein
VKGFRRPSGPVLWTAALATVSVLYMSFAVPLGRGSDELQHALRAYQISLGTIWPTIVHCPKHRIIEACAVHLPNRLTPNTRVGGPISDALQQAYHTAYVLGVLHGHGGHFNPRVYLRGLNTSFAGPASFVHFENTALYSPANYIPSAAAFWIGRHLGASVVGTVFAARLLTGALWAILITASVALVPRWKWLFAFAVLVPTGLALGSMIAADSIGLGLAPFAFAYALRLADRRATLRAAQLVALALLCLWLGFLKAPMPLLVAAVLVLAWPALGAGRARLARAAAILIPAAAAALWWTISSSHYFAVYRDIVFRPFLRLPISTTRQSHYLLTHIIDIPALFWNTATHGMLFQLNGIITSIGQDGGPGPLPEWIALVWFAVFIVLALGCREGAVPPRPARALLVAVIALFIALAALALYLTWTGVGAGVIQGVQGRYYTPMLVLLIPLIVGFTVKRFELSQRNLARLVIVFSAAGAIMVFIRTSTFFYHEAPWTVIAHVTSVVL